mmetsp:Transcript_101131/g.123828  ORF Transcript_101131/g.123828 Transcript_101131/m.123828 type:complete len:91 (-) Transcript_101131:16-288(-)
MTLRAFCVNSLICDAYCFAFESVNPFDGRIGIPSLFTRITASTPLWFFILSKCCSTSDVILTYIIILYYIYIKQTNKKRYYFFKKIIKKS